MVWRPLMPATPIRDEKRIEALIRHQMKLFPDVSEAHLRALIEEEFAATTIWKNLTYQVALKRFAVDGTRVFHLSIKRIDQKAIRDWRDFQRIKNQLLSPEHEAIELYPAESRLVDGANQYHLWGVDDPTWRFPLGFNAGRAVDDTAPPETGVRQRPIPEEAGP